MDIMRQSVCLVVKSITVYSYVFFLNCILVGQASDLAINLKRKRELVALLLLSHRCLDTVSVLLLFLTVPWVGLRFVIALASDSRPL